MENLNICPVCGYDKLSEPPYSEKDNYPSYEICKCCGFEFGFTDSSENYSFEKWREKWKNEGYKFHSKNKPKSWSERIAVNQLENANKVNYSPRIHN